MTREEKRKIEDLMTEWTCSILLAAYLFVRIGFWFINFMDCKFKIDIIREIAFQTGKSYDFAYRMACDILIIIAIALSIFLHYIFAVYEIECEDTSKLAE